MTCPERPADPAAAKEVASAWFRTGTRLFESRLYKKALATFLCTQRIVPNKMTLYLIGRSAEAAGMYRAALVTYRRLLAQPPEGDVHLREAKDALGPHMALCGGIDQKEFLVKATPAEVEKKVKKVVEVMKPGGGYLLSTVDYLSEETPLENVKAFVDAGLKYGRFEK